MSKGAQLSGTVHNMLVSKKVITDKKINVLPLKKPIAKEIKEEAPKAEATESAPAQVEAEASVEEVVSTEAVAE
jgi:hypothetical protein